MEAATFLCIWMFLDPLNCCVKNSKDPYCNVRMDEKERLPKTISQKKRGKEGAETFSGQQTVFSEA